MWKTVLPCLLICLLHVGMPSPPEPQYLLMVPTVLHGQHTEKACLLLKHLNEPVTLSLMLEHSAKNESLVSDFVAKEDMDPCWDLPVAQVESDEVVYITLHGKGKNMEFSEKKSILLQPLQNLVFVQTDKPIYKPGQKVLFRVVALDEDFHPVHDKFPVIYIEDSQKNRVGQWRDVETGEGIIQLSFSLDSEPLQGTYKVVVQRSLGQQVEHPFTVEEYVLPKYEVLVTVPKTLTILAEEIKVTACAMYTYGKPVPGVITVSVCRKYRQRYSGCYGKESEAVCEEFTRAVDSNGCFLETVPTKIFQMKRSGYEDSIQVTAKMVEEGTEVELTGEGSSEISSTIGRVSFLHVDRYYKKNLPLHGQVRLEDSTGSPLANETVSLTVGQDNLKFNYTTDQEGKASFSIDTSSLSGLSQYLSVTFKSSQYCGDRNWVSPSYNEDQRTAQYFYSKSESYVKIHPIYRTLEPGHEEHITVHYIVSAEGMGDANNLVFHYLMMARGGIVTNGRHAVEVPLANHGVPGTFTLSLMIKTDIAPLAKMLIVAVLPNGEIIADSSNFNIARAFANKVNLHFSPTEGLPASQTSLLLEAHPGSLCALRVVDKSVLLMKPEAELSVDSVYDLLPVKDLSGYYHGGKNLKEADLEPCVKANPIFLNGLFYSPTSLDSEGDVYEILELMGLKAITNSHIRKPNVCSPPVSYSYDIASRSSVMSRTFAEPEMLALTLSAQETTRKYFPETWLWQLEAIDSTGKSKLPLTIPDTITEWKANMFCLEKETGFGLSPTVSMTAFQPFFVDITIPYSVFRGEAFSVKATVVNYLNQGIRIQIKLADCDNYHAEAIGKEEDAYCIPANERVTVAWAVTPKSLGEANFTVSAETLEGEGMCGNMIVTQPALRRKDTVIRTLLVEPEGIEKEETSNSLFCAKADVPVIDKISMKVPDNVVEGSARAYFSVIGDIMGIAVQNLHTLLRMPFGCGEQNMVLFAPNIYVLDYLNKTGQLTEEIKSKAIGYLVSGYQRQLKYRHSDGSYSAFGSPGEGNTWLTAFTLKSFAQARRYIYIDERQLSDTMQWLSAHQKDNGCFQNKGKLFNNAIQGGVDDDITHSAYVTLALLEYPLPATHPVVRNALFCLETTSKGLTNVYTKALMAYAFALAGKEDLLAELIASLHKESIKKDGTIHWHRISSEHQDHHHEEPVPFIWTPPRAPSAEVEMASYVLLAHLSKHPVSQEDLTNAAKIVAWITKHQNPNGGFTSTQDTVVALHALAQYGAVTYVKNGACTVTVHTDTKFETLFHVDDGNRLLLQRIKLPTASEMYHVEVKGHGCIYTQSTLRYNIPRPTGDAPFDLHVWTEPDTCNQKSQKNFDVYVNVSYTGKRPSSNMAILDVKMPSGYIPRKSTVKQVQFLDFVGRTETLPNAAIFYLEHVSNATYSLHFSIEREFIVTNLKPAMVTVTDYYKPDEYAIEDYSAPCSTDPVKGSTS